MALVDDFKAMRQGCPQKGHQHSASDHSTFAKGCNPNDHWDASYPTDAIAIRRLAGPTNASQFDPRSIPEPTSNQPTGLAVLDSCLHPTDLPGAFPLKDRRPVWRDLQHHQSTSNTL